MVHRESITQTPLTGLEQTPLIYRDQRLIAVNKPSGMLVHRGQANDDVTVADIVRDQWVGRPVHAVHRLDRGTSGVLLFALDADAARCMQEQFKNGQIVKRYLALVRGPMTEPRELDHPLPCEKGGARVPAVTIFQPLAHSGRWSLVEARPLTGRWHQIRHHLKHLSHPIVGDVRYGKGEINRYFREQYGLHRLALHAISMEFMPPDGGSLELTAAVPPDLAEPLTRLGLWPRDVM
jgi:tRNA pseudouridine65 synthase